MRVDAGRCLYLKDGRDLLLEDGRTALMVFRDWGDSIRSFGQSCNT